MKFLMSLPKPDFFYKPERLERFWEFVRWLLKFNMPFIAMGAALIVVGLMGGLIIDFMVQARDGERNDSDDDDPDIHYY